MTRLAGRGAVCILQNRARFVVTNADFQFPAKNGKKLPGNGSIVAALSTSVRRPPDLVVAKPSPFILERILAATDAPPHRVLMVGDMWSDVKFGHSVGAHSALVLSGVATLDDVAAWVQPGVLPAEPAEVVPDHILDHVGGIFDGELRHPHPKGPWNPHRECGISEPYLWTDHACGCHAGYVGKLMARGLLPGLSVFLNWSFVAGLATCGLPAMFYVLSRRR